MRGGEGESATLRVLQVIPVLAQGGAEALASLLTFALRERVAHVAVAGKTGASEAVGGPAIELPLRESGIPIHHIPRPQQRPLLLGEAVLRLTAILRVERPDVVHAHNPAAATAARLARILSGRRRTAIVTTYHGVRPERVRAAARALALSSDVVVGVGPTATRALVAAGVPAERTATVYNAVAQRPLRGRDEMRAELGIPPDAELVVNVGRYAAEKNQALLLDALRVLVPSRPSLHALVVGFGPLEAELRALANAPELEGRVHVTGGRADARDVMAAADVFALSSDWETLPLVLIEAMLGGTPVVTTGVTDVGDLARSGETALVVPPRDAAALAGAIARLLDDGRLRDRLSAAARDLVEACCTPEAMADAYCRVYVEAVARRRARASVLRAGASPSR